jgi:hypothetical protein
MSAFVQAVAASPLFTMGKVAAPATTVEPVASHEERRP